MASGIDNGIIKNAGPLQQAKRGPERRGREDDAIPLEMNTIPNLKPTWPDKTTADAHVILCTFIICSVRHITLRRKEVNLIVME